MKTLNGTIDASRLFLVAAIYFGAALISIPTMIFSISLWLLRLTAYCLAFNSLSIHDILNRELSRETIESVQKVAVRHAQSKKLFYAKYWAAVTLFLIVPTLFLIVALLVLGSTSPSLMGPAVVTLPPWSTASACCAAFVALMYISEVSIVGLFVSGTTTDKDVMNLAKKTMILSFKHIIPLGLITFAGAAVTMLLTSPGELFHLTKGEDAGLNVTWMNVAEELWRSFSSTVVWTLTLSPMCEYLRGKLSESKS